jgi:hypothetical protein
MRSPFARTGAGYDADPGRIVSTPDPGPRTIRNSRVYSGQSPCANQQQAGPGHLQGFDSAVLLVLSSPVSSISYALCISPHAEKKAGGWKNLLRETTAFSLRFIRSCDKDHRHHLAEPQAVALPTEKEGTRRPLLPRGALVMAGDIVK